MKREILGYISALVNLYDKEIPKGHPPLIHLQGVQKSIDDLYEFVIDIEDEEAKEPVVAVDNNGLVKILRKRVLELEESCQNDNEVIKNLQRKNDDADKEIGELEEGNKNDEEIINILQNKNNGLRDENFDKDAQIENLQKKIVLLKANNKAFEIANEGLRRREV
jgi:hypothetical protein